MSDTHNGFNRRNTLLWMTTLFHTAFFLAILLGPLVNSNYLLTLHLMFIPFIIAHWISGDNTCAITLVERGIRRSQQGNKYDDDTCVSCKVIEPIFDFPKYFPKYYKPIILIGIFLWSISAYKMYNKYSNGEIRGWRDIFRL